ncbi:uncharacterized protein GJ701_004321 [Geothlypis trichas]
MWRERRSERCAEIRVGACCWCCAGSKAFRWDRDRDLGLGIRVLVLPVFPVGAVPSRFFLGGQSTGAGAGGSRWDWGWDRDRHRCGRKEPLRDRCCRSGCCRLMAGSRRGSRHAPAAAAGSRCCAAAMPARRTTLPGSSLWIAAGSGKDTEPARTGPGTPSARPGTQRGAPPGGHGAAPQPPRPGNPGGHRGPPRPGNPGGHRGPPRTGNPTSTALP